jgi:two-component system C4-dicarboxylate transport response regulator DctD
VEEIQARLEDLLVARMDNYERGLIREALRGARGNVAEAARLHLLKKTLYDKLTRHPIDPETFRK